MFHQVFIGGGGWLMGRYSALAGGGSQVIICTLFVLYLHICISY